MCVSGLAVGMVLGLQGYNTLVRFGADAFFDEDDPTARCEWSLELELQRLFAGMAMLATMVRMTDVYTFSKGAGILMVCIKEMAVNMYEPRNSGAILRNSL